MDNDSTQKSDVNNTSTQKTVRLKPLVKQPLVGDNSTESQSVKKVSTNSSPFPKVGTQTGRISSIATNTARVVRINSALKNTSNVTGPNTTMMDFKTSELQMAAPSQPNTTRPAAAPKNVLNALNLKPKVAEASVVETPAAAAPVPVATVDEETQTAAIPKAPAPIRPNIKLSTTPPPMTPPAAPKMPAPAPAPTAAPAAEQPNDTQTAAVAKPAPVKPVINLNSKPAIPAAAAPAANPTVPATPVTESTQESDDATVKLKRPVKTGTSQTNSVVPNITSAPKINVPTPAAAPNAVKPSQAPTVKFNLNKSQDSTPETVKFPTPSASAPTVPEIKPDADAKPKLGLKKAEEPAPAAEAPKVEEKAPESATAAKADETAEPKKKKKKSVAAAAAAGASSSVKKKSAAPTASSEAYGFHLSVGFLAAIALIAAATICWVQYLNTYKPQILGRYVQIPFMEQVGK